ncbi:MAG: hypothetical protein EOO29_33325, partial [Comamonadaceae bacterium]
MAQSHPYCESLLAEVERQVGAVDACLLDGDAPALEIAVTRLRASGLAFAEAVSSDLRAPSFEPAFRKRVDDVARRLSLQRGQLVRRSAVVERTLASILRTPAAATYSMPGRSFG